MAAHAAQLEARSGRGARRPDARSLLPSTAWTGRRAPRAASRSADHVAGVEHDVARLGLVPPRAGGRRGPRGGGCRRGRAGGGRVVMVPSCPVASGDMATEVLDVPTRSRYEVTVDGELAGFSEYRDTRARCSPTRCSTPTGKGVGSALAGGARRRAGGRGAGWWRCARSSPPSSSGTTVRRPGGRRAHHGCEPGAEGPGGCE